MCRCWVALRFELQKANRRPGLARRSRCWPCLRFPVLDRLNASPLRDNHDASRPLQTVSPLQEAEELIQQGLFEQAKDNHSKSNSDCNPSSVEAYNLLGNCLHRRKRLRPRARRLPACAETGSQLYKDPQQPRQSICRSAETRSRRKRVHKSPEPGSGESRCKLQPGSASPRKGSAPRGHSTFSASSSSERRNSIQSWCAPIFKQEELPRH